MPPSPKPGAKPDEMALWAALVAGEWPRTAGPRLGIPSRRVWYLCEKWARQGIYDYGVSCDLGWINQHPDFPPTHLTVSSIAENVREIIRHATS